VVRDGDSLQSVAHNAYGDPTLWRRIAEANGIDDPLSIPRGTVLSIPTLMG
jgi:nucleoid-associated protein YgaU